MDWQEELHTLTALYISLEDFEETPWKGNYKGADEDINNSQVNEKEN